MIECGAARSYLSYLSGVLPDPPKLQCGPRCFFCFREGGPWAGKTAPPARDGRPGQGDLERRRMTESG